MIKSSPFTRCISLSAVLVSVSLLSACGDNADSPHASTTGTSYQAPRNSHGQPDLQGIWDFRTLTPLERPAALGDKATFTRAEAEAFRKKAIESNDVDHNRDAMGEFDVEGAYNAWWMDYGTELGGDLRTSLITSPTNGRLPELTAEALAGMKRDLQRIPPTRVVVSLEMDNRVWRPEGPEVLGLSERCLLGFNAGPPLIPSAYNNNLRIIQTPDHVVLLTEMIHDARIVPLDGGSHLPEDMLRWSGDSRGHWEGDTLVVETKNFTDKTPTFQLPLDLNNLDRNGVVGSGKNMHLIEKFTRVSDNTVMYEYTLTDPYTFADPFTVAIPMKASDSQMFEYACHEGNYAMPGMLNGARQLEKEDAGLAIQN